MLSPPCVQEGPGDDVYTFTLVMGSIVDQWGPVSGWCGPRLIGFIFNALPDQLRRARTPQDTVSMDLHVYWFVF